MFAQVFCSACTRLFSVCARDVLAVVETAPGVYICIKKNATLRRRLSHIWLQIKVLCSRMEHLTLDECFSFIVSPGSLYFSVKRLIY